MNVPYEKQTLDTPNPIARFAHRSRFKRSKALVQPYLKQSARLLDYGCGHGRFLNEIALENPEVLENRVELLGYDPYLSIDYPGLRIVSDTSAIADASLDLLTCLETCEHLDEEETQDFLNFANRALKPAGNIIVTVPLMVGPAVLLKEFNRMILHRRWTDMSLQELAVVSFGVLPRRAENIKSSHRGYDWRKTHRQFSEGSCQL